MMTEHLVTPVVLSVGSAGYGMNLGGTIYPQIQVICTNCGHTQYFNAIIMGISPRGAEVNEKSGGEDKKDV